MGFPLQSRGVKVVSKVVEKFGQSFPLFQSCTVACFVGQLGVGVEINFRIRPLRFDEIAATCPTILDVSQHCSTAGQHLT